MNFPSIFTVLILAYLIGSIPFGLIIVKILKGHDIRTIESGRTGGTNAGRAAGFGAGVLTGVQEFFKAVVAVLITRTILPDTPLEPWLEAASGVLAILGHNYSLFLMEKVTHGKFKFRGGAGGAPCLGASVAMYPPALLIILPAALVVFFGAGYASMATLSIAGISIVVFLYNAITGLSQASWAYVVYAVFAQALLVIALRPNIVRLINGTERPVGLRAYLLKKKNSGTPGGN